MSAETTQPPYTVVVGVSATSKSAAAVAWASAQATANNGRLIAVRVLKRSPSPQASMPPTSQDTRSRRPTDQRARLAADVAETLGADHEAECRVLHGGKRKCLLAAASGADLLVIDAVRSTSSSSMLAHRIIAAAECPVVVLPPALTHEPPSWISKAGKLVGETSLQAVGTSGRPGYRPPQRP